MDGIPQTARTFADGRHRTVAVLRAHWPEYLMEAAGLGLFMVSACMWTALLEHPASPVRQSLPSGDLRRGLIGLAMGLTAMAIVYSPWGKQSGAHLNPAVTLSFWRLGKIRPVDALFYVLAQLLGGAVGVALSGRLLGHLVSDPPVGFVATVPGPAGAGVAFAAELLISFGMMSSVLRISSHPRLARLTGVFAGILVATYILLEAPLSGMSMNPARTLASALSAGVWRDLWLYFTAPPLGMLLAAQLFLATHRGRYEACAKLQHQNRKRCIFCDYRQELTSSRPTS